MTSSFSTILGIKILADAATLLKKDDDAAHYGGVVKDQLERWHATYYNTTDALVSEKHGRFIHPAQEPDSKKVSPTPSSAEKRRSKAVANSWAAVPEWRHLLPTSAVPGRLHIVSSAAAFFKNDLVQRVSSPLLPTAGRAARTTGSAPAPTTGCTSSRTAKPTLRAVVPRRRAAGPTSSEG